MFCIPGGEGVESLSCSFRETTIQRSIVATSPSGDYNKILSLWRYSTCSTPASRASFSFCFLRLQPEYILRILICCNNSTSKQKPFKLPHQNIERFRQIYPADWFAFNNRFVSFWAPGTSSDLIVKISCKVCSGAISFQSPNFHFSETLSAELRLAAQWLLCNQAVWTNRSLVNFIFHHMIEFKQCNYNRR